MCFIHEVFRIRLNIRIMLADSKGLQNDYKITGNNNIRKYAFTTIIITLWIFVFNCEKFKRK